MIGEKLTVTLISSHRRKEKTFTDTLLSMHSGLMTFENVGRFKTSSVQKWHFAVKDKKYLVLINNVPSKEHDSIEEAETEAKRLLLYNLRCGARIYDTAYIITIEKTIKIKENITYDILIN